MKTSLTFLALAGVLTAAAPAGAMAAPTHSATDNPSAADACATAGCLLVLAGSSDGGSLPGLPGGRGGDSGDERQARRDHDRDADREEPGFWSWLFGWGRDGRDGRDGAGPGGGEGGAGGAGIAGGRGGAGGKGGSGF